MSETSTGQQTGQRNDPLAVFRAASRRWLVAGTAGGVGTTTVTALVFAAIRDRVASAPLLLDHTAGTLGARLPDGDEARAVDPRWTLHDLGPHAAGAGVEALADPGTTLVLVSAASGVGAALATDTLDRIRAERGPDGLRRTVVVLAGTVGRHRIGREVATLAATESLRGVAVLTTDFALGAGGRIPLPRVSRRARQAVDTTLDLLLDH